MSLKDHPMLIVVSILLAEVGCVLSRCKINPNTCSRSCTVLFGAVARSAIDLIRKFYPINFQNMIDMFKYPVSTLESMLKLVKIL